MIHLWWTEWSDASTSNSYCSKTPGTDFESNVSLPEYWRCLSRSIIFSSCYIPLNLERATKISQNSSITMTKKYCAEKKYNTIIIILMIEIWQWVWSGIHCPHVISELQILMVRNFELPASRSRSASLPIWVLLRCWTSCSRIWIFAESPDLIVLDSSFPSSKTQPDNRFRRIPRLFKKLNNLVNHNRRRHNRASKSFSCSNQKFRRSQIAIVSSKDLHETLLMMWINAGNIEFDFVESIGKGFQVWVSSARPGAFPSPSFDPVDER